MQITVKAIKSLMKKELYAHYQAACANTYDSRWRAFIHRGYHSCIVPKLESAETMDDLEEVLSDMDYGMSVEDWVNSL